jgi:hypothetical protein
MHFTKFEQSKIIGATRTCSSVILLGIFSLSLRFLFVLCSCALPLPASVGTFLCLCL